MLHTNAKTVQNKFASGIRNVGALILVLAAMLVQADPIIYTQFLNTNLSDPNNLGLASQNSPAVFPPQIPFARAYDDFRFATGATITDVHWTMEFLQGADAPGSVTGFTIQIWSNIGNAPPPFGPSPNGSTPLYGATISGTGFPTAGVTCGFNGLGVCHDYAADIAPFVAAPNTTYWLSIVPNLTFPPQVFWAAGTGGNGVSHIDFEGVRDAPGSIRPDLAFELSGILGGGTVPEPATLALLAVGLAGLGFSRRKH